MTATPAPERPSALSVPELVAMVAALSALNALSIDIMLPALPDIGAAFDLARDNDRQLVVMAYVAPFGVAQLAYGPLADAYGRRSVLIWALGLFVVGAVLCVFAPSYELFLAARALQGLGAAATRVVSNAVVRDLMAGPRMAQVMSMAMTLFMVVPIIAPGIGQLILFVAPWRWIFAALLFYALAVLAWAWLRLPETLKPENRTPLRPAAAVNAYLSVLGNRQMAGYSLAALFIASALFAYITVSEQIFVEVYRLGAAFPLAFASIAIVIALGAYVNSRLVMRFGMRRISHIMTLWFACAAAVNAALVALGASQLWVFMPVLALTLGAFSLIISNFSAIALEPMGRHAGVASALFGAATSTGGAVAGGLVAGGFDGTPLPFLLGLTALGTLSLATLWVTERGKLFDRC